MKPSSPVIHVSEMADFIDSVYVGRANGRHSLRGSLLANPFAIGRDGDRNEVIALYRDWLWGKLGDPAYRPAFLKALRNVQGRPLACWCRRSNQSEPACHADVILEVLNEAAS